MIFLRRQHDRTQGDAQGFSPLFFQSTDQQESIRMVRRILTTAKRQTCGRWSRPSSTTRCYSEVEIFVTPQKSGEPPAWRFPTIYAPYGCFKCTSLYLCRLVIRNSLWKVKLQSSRDDTISKGQGALIEFSHIRIT